MKGSELMFATGTVVGILTAVSVSAVLEHVSLPGWLSLGLFLPVAVGYLYQIGRGWYRRDARMISSEAPRKEPCGGCAGLGSHQRWCPAVVGARAARIGRTADDLDDLGDTLPPDPANRCWALAERLREVAEAARASFLADHPPFTK